MYGSRANGYEAVTDIFTGADIGSHHVPGIINMFRDIGYTEDMDGFGFLAIGINYLEVKNSSNNFNFSLA